MAFGSDIRWVDTVLGSNGPVPPTSRNGDLALSSPSATYPSGAGLGATIAIAKGCLSPGDGGGGIFFWVPGTATDDGGNIIVPPISGGAGGYWQRLLSC